MLTTLSCPNKAAEETAARRVANNVRVKNRCFVVYVSNNQWIHTKNGMKYCSLYFTF